MAVGYAAVNGLHIIDKLYGVIYFYRNGCAGWVGDGDEIAHEYIYKLR